MTENSAPTVRIPDTARAYQVLDHILAHPEQHDQGIWMNECGTVACLAGWTCLLAGDQPVCRPLWTDYMAVRVGDTHRLRKIRGRAKELLGIDDLQADYLFDASNSIDDLIEEIEKIFGKRP